MKGKGRALTVTCCLWGACAYEAAAQTTVANQSTTPPADARYEIVQSALTAKVTLRLDRFTGETDQLTIRLDSTLTWEKFPRSNGGLPDTKISGRANYQVFTSGLGVRITFLMNVNTGASWQLREHPEGRLFWNPLK